ncbi:TGF-beta domain-containing family member maverick [Calliopsis andreniformis]|uniref:TGF-beta domain-containing family member maverick n=1 Tax=Calliopsis andreniformis TaxID=337506 RepID=UPI003FCD838C
MGKLATIRRRVTRDNEEQEVSVYSLGPSAISSGRAFVTAPIRGIGFNSKFLDSCILRRVCECGSSIDGVTPASDSFKGRIRKVGRTGDCEPFDNPGTRSFIETAAGNEPFDDLCVLDDAGVQEERLWVNTQTKSSSEGKVAAKQCRRNLSSILLIAMAIAALCSPVSAVPMSPRVDPLLRTGPQHGLDRSTGLEDVYEDTFEDAFQEEDHRQPTKTLLDESELEIIRRSIARGLGLKRIPDPSKANVSQAEYERAHREYLKKVQKLSSDEEHSKSRKKLHVFWGTVHPGNGSKGVYKTSDRRGQYRHGLFFPVEISEADRNASVDHATLRLFLHGHYSERSEKLDVLVYLKTYQSRKLIVQKRIELLDSRNSIWLELDSTAALSSWLEAGLENLDLELEFLQDGEPLQRTFSSPVLNVFTELTSQSNGRSKRSTPEELMSLHKGRRTKCKGESKKCCRHELTVMFKDLKGFEFIVYPKTFDAGYCKGRCPPRYNPAHHHALLQSLLWKEDRKRVPKPCCAPSKLDQLMIVYFDENDSTQLKVSYWKNIQVLECACS